MQEDGREYDPADMFGQWLHSAKDVFVPKYSNMYTGKIRPMLPSSTSYTGQMYIGDEEQCGASQRFIVPAPCSQVRYMALGLPFCTCILCMTVTFTYLFNPLCCAGNFIDHFSGQVELNDF